MRKVFVLRYGHRPGRDKRVTTHAALVARAFGADGFVLSDVKDPVVEKTIRKVLEYWGGVFTYIDEVNYRKFCEDWKRNGGIIVHLTMYGLHVDDIIDEIRNRVEDILVVIGSQKVPRYFYEIADYNVAIGNQPHSEIAALAIFLDRLFDKKELRKEFHGAKLKIIPHPRGKKVVSLKPGEESTERA